MRRVAIVVSVLAFPGVLLAQGARTCAVNDPTGTPLNVREQPYRRIVGAYSNGTPVRIYETTRDGAGDAWVRIEPVGAGKSGWVFRKFIDCPSG